MRGVVTGRDVLLNLRVIWAEFGPGVAVCCVGAVLRGRPTTFLDVALKQAPAQRGRSDRAASR
ncbi:MAG: hypothetical protein HY901_13590 [Deltaproteobacteria bacterium]|nr:hypothetical protein [Deltaproteobacteria bacterium]